MDERKFEIIKSLMSELEGLMGPSKEDFSSRLGREEEPAVEVMSVEGEMPEDEMAGDEMGDMEMDSPEEKLKQRLLKLRG